MAVKRSGVNAQPLGVATPGEVAIELGKKCDRQAAVRGLPSGVIQIDPLAGDSDFFAAADLR